MAIHVLERTQVIRASVAEAWDFFSNPANLARITPKSLDFQVLTKLPARMYAGMTIAYRVRPLLGIPMHWLTEITHVEEGRHFVDTQLIGPYRVWHHEHHFRELPDGFVEMRDRVTYALPFGWLGEIAHPFLVEPQLRQIFDFRTQAVREIFPEHPAKESR